MNIVMIMRMPQTVPRIFILRNVLLLRSVIIKEISGFNALSSDRFIYTTFLIDIF